MDAKTKAHNIFLLRLLIFWFARLCSSKARANRHYIPGWVAHYPPIKEKLRGTNNRDIGHRGGICTLRETASAYSTLFDDKKGILSPEPRLLLGYN